MNPEQKAGAAAMAPGKSSSFLSCAFSPGVSVGAEIQDQ